jgi:putative molybdopterin biosynthesis protein
MDKLYTIKEVAEHLKVTEITIRNWIRDGNLEAHKIGNNIRITQTEIDRLTKESVIEVEEIKD